MLDYGTIDQPRGDLTIKADKTKCKKPTRNRGLRRSKMSKNSLVWVKNDILKTALAVGNCLVCIFNRIICNGLLGYDTDYWETSSK